MRPLGGSYQIFQKTRYPAVFYHTREAVWTAAAGNNTEAIVGLGEGATLREAVAGIARCAPNAEAPPQKIGVFEHEKDQRQVVSSEARHGIRD